MHFEYEKSLQKGIRFLEKNQHKDGSFISMVASDKEFKKARKRNSIFPSCLILSCLSDIESKNLKLKLANFILSQKSELETFNYWKRGSAESKKIPYPDDLDDTFCALSSLQKYNPNLIKTNTLAKAVELLVFTEEREGGPYRTWIVSPKSDRVWKDIDLAVNSNVAFFLSLQEVRLKNIENLVEKAILEKKYNSPYYYFEFPVIYFISRFYQGKNKNKIIDFLLSEKNKNPLSVALKISSLLNLGYEKLEHLENDIRFLIVSQKKSGEWKCLPFVIEAKENKKTYYAGSAELTSAFCLEAIQKYVEKTKKHNKKVIRDEKAQKIKKSIIEITKNKFDFFEKEDRDIFDKILSEIIRKDSKNRITLLSYFFRESLGKNINKIDDEFIIQLGSANLLGWIAYTIYDDFLDGEGKAKTLPLANVCLRELSRIFFEAGSRIKGFDHFFEELMNGLEKFNLWEISNCRAEFFEGKIIIPRKFPDYGNLSKISERSMGHILGLVAISSKTENGQKETKKLISCFRHHIASEQLNDDAHDWEDDLKKGNLSPVVCELLKIFRKKYKKQYIDFSKDREKLRKIFWLEVIDKISKKIIQNSLRAQKIFKTIKIIENPVLFMNFFQSVEKSAKNLLKEKKEVAVFLENIKTRA